MKSGFRWKYHEFGFHNEERGEVHQKFELGLAVFFSFFFFIFLCPLTYLYVSIIIYIYIKRGVGRMAESKLCTLLFNSTKKSISCVIESHVVKG